MENPFVMREALAQPRAGERDSHGESFARSVPTARRHVNLRSHYATRRRTWQENAARSKKIAHQSWGAVPKRPPDFEAPTLFPKGQTHPGQGAKKAAAKKSRGR